VALVREGTVSIGGSETLKDLVLGQTKYAAEAKRPPVAVISSLPTQWKCKGIVCGPFHALMWGLHGECLTFGYNVNVSTLGVAIPENVEKPEVVGVLGRGVGLKAAGPGLVSGILGSVVGGNHFLFFWIKY
jgi:hypothetical protein